MKRAFLVKNIKIKSNIVLTTIYSSIRTKAKVPTARLPEILHVASHSNSRNRFESSHPATSR